MPLHFNSYIFVEKLDHIKVLLIQKNSKDSTNWGTYEIYLQLVIQKESF